MANPLFLLLDSDLIQKLIDRLDHLIGLEAAKELFARGNVLSPMSRHPISCVLTFGTHETHIKATNFALANLLFGNKLVGLPEMWISVLYFVIQKVPYLSENVPFMKTFENHMIHRMKGMPTNMMLTGLPVDPLLKCPIDIAIWYCVVSPFIVNNTTNVDDACNCLCSFGPTAKYLLQLTDVLGYPYDKEWTLHQMSLYKAFAWMMNEEKAHTQWRNLLCAQYQNSLVLSNGKIILLDGPACDTKPSLPSFKATDQAPEPLLGELIALASFVDHNKTTNSVMIPLKPFGVEIPSWKKNYSYEIDQFSTLHPELSPKTFCPYVIDRKTKKHWLDCVVENFGSRYISLYNYFIRFVTELDRYPEMEEFIEYVANKQANREDGNAVDTLPAGALFFVKDVFANYEKVLGKNFVDVPPHQFKSVTGFSRSRIEQAILDGSNGPPVEGNRDSNALEATNLDSFWTLE